MRDLLFDKLHIGKDGKVDFERLGKITGLSKADLVFFIKGDFDFVDRASMVSGVFIGKRSIVPNGIFPQRWDLRTCHNKPEDLSYVSKLVANHGNDFNRPYEYFVMDSAGRIVLSNCAVSTTTNEQDVIHLTAKDESLDEYVYPTQLKQRSYKCYYCHDESMDGLNEQIKTYASQKYIVKPEQFGKGFESKSSQDKPQEMGQ